MKSPANIADHIRVRRGQFVILDADLAALFDIEPQCLVDLVQRIQTILAGEFSFVVESNQSSGTTRAFTEFGVLMAAGALNTPHAVEMSIQIVRAIVKMRKARGVQTKPTLREGRPNRVLH